MRLSALPLVAGAGRESLSRRVPLFGEQSGGEALPLGDALDLERDRVDGLIEVRELG